MAVSAEKSGPGRRRITIHKELQRRRLHGVVAFGLVLRLGLVVVALIVVVEVVVLAVVDWQRWTPVRRAVVLESAHGRWSRCSSDPGDGVGVDFVGLRRVFPFLRWEPERRGVEREGGKGTFFCSSSVSPAASLRPIWRNSRGSGLKN